MEVINLELCAVSILLLLVSLGPGDKLPYFGT